MRLNPYCILGGVLTYVMSVHLYAADHIRIDIRPDAMTDEAVYRLGDIADVHTENVEQRHALERLVIGHAPRVGGLGYVSRIDIEARVRSTMGQSMEPIEWGGPVIAKVRTMGRELPDDELVAAAEKTLRQWLADKVGPASMQLASDVEHILVPDGKVDLQARIRDTAHIAPRMSVWVDVSITGKHYQSVPVWFEVSAKRQVYSVTKDLPTGHVLTTDDLELTETDIAAVRGRAWKTEMPLEGLRVRKWVAASTVLTEELLEPVPDVVKGQKVIVTATSGPVALRVPAIALKDGNVNDVIPVVRQQRRDEFQVLVIGKGQAVVADATSNDE